MSSLSGLMDLPFQLSPDVNWGESSVATTCMLDFRSDPARREFRRFLYRDLVVAFAGLLYIGGCFTFPTFLIDTGPGTVPNLAIGGLLVLLVSSELWLHFRQPLTFAVASFRRRVQVTIACLLLVTTTWGATIAYYERCANASFPLKHLIDPNLTPWRVQQYCRSIINPLLAVTIRTVSMFPFPPALALLPLSSCLAQDVLSRFAIVTYAQHPESGDDIAVKAVGMVLLCAISMSKMVTTHRSYMSSFVGEVAAAVERERSAKLEEDVDLLLCAMLPSSALARLAAHCEVSDWTSEASVLHSDIVQFTAWSSSRSAHQVVAMLNRLWIDIDRLAEVSGMTKVKTVGDAYWAVCGLPDEEVDHAEKTCDFGLAMLERLQQLNGRHREWGAITMRVGIHSGPLWGGVLGTRQLSYEVFGPTSEVAEAVEKVGVPSRVAISSATLSRLGLTAESVGCAFALPPLPTRGEDEGRLPAAAEEYYLLQRLTIAQHRRLERDAVMLRVSHHTRGLTPLGRPPHSEGSASSHRSNTSFRSGRAPGQFLPTTSAEAKQQRMRFLAEKAALTAAEPTLEEVEERCSARRWKWLLLDFADATVERDYLKFVAEHTFRTRALGRIYVLLLVVYVTFGIAMNSGAFPLNTAALLAISGLLAVADVGFTSKTNTAARRKLLASLCANYLAAICLLVGAGIAPAGTSVATNEITYLYCDLAVHTAFANVGILSAAPLCLFNLLVLVPLAIALQSDTVMLFEAAALVVLSCVAQAFGLVVRERGYRRLFLEARIAEHFRSQQQRRRQEQRALLESVVPPHVVPALIDWLSVDLDLTRTVAFAYPLVAVAFVRFCEDTIRGDHSIESHPITLIQYSPEQSEHDASTSLSSMHTLIPFDPPPFANYRLFELHRSVDDTVARYPAVCKIKSFGDSIMLAGSLVEAFTFEEAAQQMVAAIWELRRDSSPQLQAGIHCGEAVGAVLGRSRLCFDIFGDTVNVASRAMTCGSSGRILATEEFVEALGAVRNPNPSGVVDEIPLCVDAFLEEPCPPIGSAAALGLHFGPSIDAAAKGKGRLTLREVSGVELPIPATRDGCDPSKSATVQRPASPLF